MARKKVYNDSPNYAGAAGTRENIFEGSPRRTGFTMSNGTGTVNDSQVPDILRQSAEDMAFEYLTNRPASNSERFQNTMNKAQGWVGKNFRWSPSQGAQLFGKNMGGIANGINAGIQGIQAVQGINNLSNSTDELEDLLNEIVIASSSNPLVNSYLTPSQKSLLQKVNRGKFDTSVDFGDFIPQDLSGLGDVLLSTGGGLLTGGVPGAIIGGVGGIVNAGLDNANSEQARQIAELEALLMALEDADMQYQSMKRPNFTGLGIQQQYQNMYR